MRGEWRVYLGLTMTGDIGTRLRVASGSLTHTLNGHDEARVTFDRASLDGVEQQWWAYRSGALVISYVGGDGLERLVSVCPISSAVPEENREDGTVTVEGKGVSWLLEDRVVLTEDYTARDALALRSTAVIIRDKTFRAIAAEIVHQATSGKLQGHLPIALPSRTERGTHDRTYEGYNVANNGAWKRLQELTEVIGGPDLQLRPEYANDEGTRFQWRLLVGTDQQQTLPQTQDVLLDGTAPDTEVASISVTSDATLVAHRVYATGAGEGAAVALAQADVPRIPQYMPLVEKTISDSDAEGSTGRALLQRKAQGALFASHMDQVSLTIRSNPDSLPIGSWWCGELAQVVTAGWLAVPDGELLLRMISTKYSLGSDVVNIECQEDTLGGDYAW